MNPRLQERIEKVKREGFSLDFNVLLNQTVELYKKTFLLSGVALLLFIILMFIVVMSVMFNLIDPEMVRDNPDYMAELLKEPSNFAIYLGASVVFAGLTAPMNAGFLEIQRRAHQNTPFSIGTIFLYYSNVKFWKLLILGLVVGLISNAVNGGIELLHFPGSGLISIVFSFVFGLLTLLAIPLVIFGEQGPLDALGTSCTLVSKGFGTIAGLYIVGFFVVLSGIIACCIGIAFTAPFLIGTIFVIYNAIIGFPDVPSALNTLSSDENPSPFQHPEE